MAKAIEKDIESGALAPGERLENEIALAGRLRVSRPTARRALQELVDLGMLVRKRGVGKPARLPHRFSQGGSPRDRSRRSASSR
jgi:DNA-binding GntR family transcriptional regulator